MSRRLLFYLPLLFLPITAVTTTPTTAGNDESCRCTPADACWPSTSTWSQLNTTLSGKLIRNTPLAQACHDPFFDQIECERIQSLWALPEFHVNSSSSVLSTLFTGAPAPCSPFTPRNASCELGGEVPYAVDVESPADVATVLEFTKTHNIRLVVRNTGHDLLGKSTAYGGLALWTHNLKGIEFIDQYSSPSTAYTGETVKVGAGVEDGDLYVAAAARGRVVVGGDCRTVGLAGGYIQGGGHSSLTSLYGMAADQALEFEVVTVDGKALTVNAQEHPDLFWALRGGGGGTYAIVLSVTIKTYPEFSVTSIASLSFSYPNTTNTTSFWSAVKLYQTLTTPITSIGAVGAAGISQSGGFALNPLIAPNSTSESLAALLQPFVQFLDQAGIEYAFNSSNHETFWGAHQTAYGELTTAGGQYGSRLIPRETFDVEEELDEFVDALRTIVEEGGVLGDNTMSPPRGIIDGDAVAVNPAWRDTEKLLVLGLPYELTSDEAFVQANAEKVTSWDRLLPGNAAYLNEADPNEPRWQEVFYGVHYARLREVKERYDPDGLLWVRTGVGSERWREVGGEGGAGITRLCWVE